MMRKYIDLFEAHHDYGDVSHDTQYEPMRHGDTVTVYHGFRDFPHAVELAKHGLSGKVRAARVYSYESDNNPYGLFVTLSRKVATEFVGAYGTQAIVEFKARTDEMEAPVWPGGSYTVQGEYSQYFGHGAKGRAARNERSRQAVGEIDHEIASATDKDHIKGSDDRLLAYMLTNSREHQALFTGHLDPHAISAWHVRSDYSGTWERISPQEFLDRYGETPLSRDSRAAEKLFTPNEEFNGEAFITRLRGRFGNGRDDEFFVDFVRSSWERIMASRDKTRTFHEYYEMYMWPKQYIPCLQWMRREFGKTSH
jgi:hypothetical protein